MVFLPDDKKVSAFGLVLGPGAPLQDVELYFADFYNSEEELSTCLTVLHAREPTQMIHNPVLIEGYGYCLQPGHKKKLSGVKTSVSRLGSCTLCRCAQQSQAAEAKQF